jgi:hypothetical protein
MYLEPQRVRPRKRLVKGGVSVEPLRDRYEGETVTTADVQELVMTPPVYVGPDAAFDLLEGFSGITSRMLRALPPQTALRKALRNVRHELWPQNPQIPSSRFGWIWSSDPDPGERRVVPIGGPSKRVGRPRTRQKMDYYRRLLKRRDQLVAAGVRDFVKRIADEEECPRGTIASQLSRMARLQQPST